MAKRHQPRLTESELLDLKQHRDHDARPYARERRAAILKIEAGHSPHWVSRQGLLKKRKADTVYQWLALYRQARIQGLESRPQGGSLPRCL